MESKKLEALLMAVDLGSFTKAAEVLGYTQSGLTHMMNSLEKEVGFPLLERGRYGVKLTEEGERLEGAIRGFLRSNACLDNMIAQISATRNETIRVGAYSSMAMHWLPSIVERFREECPDVGVDIRMGGVEETYDLLYQGKMDAIFVSKQEGNFEWIHLKDDPMCAVLPRSYPLNGRKVFPLSEFTGKDFLMPSSGFDKDIMRVFNRYGVQPKVLPTWVDDPTTVSLVEHGLGVSLMTEMTTKGRTGSALTVPVEPMSYRELGIAVRSSEAADGSLKRFINCAQRVVAEL